VIYRPGVAGDAIGVALTVAAVAACVCYTVLTRRLLLDHSSLIVVLVQRAGALTFAVVVAGGSSTFGVADLGLPADASTWVLAASSGAVYYGFAFWFFIGGLRGGPASIAGAFLPLIPVFGLAAGYLFGDRLLNRQWLGATLVVLATAAAAVHHLTRTHPVTTRSAESAETASSKRGCLH